VISESLAQKAKATFSEKVYIPIYEYTLLQPIFQNDHDSLLYFPNVGQQLNNEGLLCSVIKSNQEDSLSTVDYKNRMLQLFNNLNVSDLINIQKSQNLTQFTVTPFKSKLEKGKVIDLKVYRLNKNAVLVDKGLHKFLDKLFHEFSENYLLNSYHDLLKQFGEDFARQIIKTNLIYFNDNKSTNRNTLRDAAYLLEFEVAKEQKSNIGDKFCTRYAGKGVLSLILPDELRPIAVNSDKPIDCVFNSFGIFSRMNISQITEGIINKNVMYAEDRILNGEDVCDVLKELNEVTIKNLNDDEYYNDVNKLIQDLENNKKLQTKFINDVKENGLFIEAPAFSEVDIKNIIKRSKGLREPVFIKKECLEYLKDKLKVDLPFEMKDVYIDNIYCSPVYMMRLHKIASDIVAARDLGKYKFVTKQPLKGKANEGGRRMGQMEIEALIGHGTTKALRELLTVKSDCVEEKSELLNQLIEKGEYHIKSSDSQIEGGTKKVVQTFMNFLND